MTERSLHRIQYFLLLFILALTTGSVVALELQNTVVTPKTYVANPSTTMTIPTFPPSSIVSPKTYVKNPSVSTVSPSTNTQTPSSTTVTPSINTITGTSTPPPSSSTTVTPTVNTITGTATKIEEPPSPQLRGSS